MKNWRQVFNTASAVNDITSLPPCSQFCKHPYVPSTIDLFLKRRTRPYRRYHTRPLTKTKQSLRPRTILLLIVGVKFPTHPTQTMIPMFPQVLSAHPLKNTIMFHLGKLYHRSISSACSQFCERVHAINISKKRVHEIPICGHVQSHAIFRLISSASQFRWPSCLRLVLAQP